MLLHYSKIGSAFLALASLVTYFFLPNLFPLALQGFLLCFGVFLITYFLFYFRKK